MSYMENHFDLRVDPRKLVPGARSVITLLMNYYPDQRPTFDGPKVSAYAWGKDYHKVIRKKLKQLLGELRSEVGEITGRGFVDSAPVLERSWATRSGLGWIGKNGNLIHPRAGSFFFIATLITDLELAYDDPMAKDYCGTCTRCIEACPTQAILPDKVIDGSKCISYFTIELKDLLLPSSAKGKMDDWAFGCDTCQDVCPWNRFSQPHKEPSFAPIIDWSGMTAQTWLQMTEENFNRLFKDSPLQRTGHRGLMRNIRFLQSGD